MAAALTSKWAAPQAPEGVPMLMIPANIEERFFSIFEGKFLYDIHIQLPEVGHSKNGIIETFSYYVGCGHGWLAKIVEDVSEFQESPVVQLFNPFRKDQVPILLPPVNDFSASGNFKVITSPDLTLNPHNCVVIVLDINEPSISFIKGGQKIWTAINGVKKCQFSDAIFYKGQVYAVENRSGMIVSFDIESSSNTVRRHKAIPPTNDMFRSSAAAYLVESTNGELLHVRRYLIIKPKPEFWEVTESFFMVYKLVFDDRDDGSIVQQIEVKNIGDEALFVGDHSPSISVMASRYPGCKPNSIYYVDDTFLVLQQMRKGFGKVPFEYHFAGVFNLEDGTSSQLYTQKYYLPESSSSFALWVTLPD